MPTRILLIRHAAIDPDSRLCGCLDLPLTEHGRAQVESLRSRDATRPAPGALYTSPLVRARDVADALGKVWALRPGLAAWAREIDCGQAEGARLDELKRAYPALWIRNEAQDDDEFAWPGGETYKQFRSRVLDGLRALARAHGDARVALVTHAGVIAQVLGTLRGRPPAVWALDRPDPFTGTEVVWDTDRPTDIVTYNDPGWY